MNPDSAPDLSEIALKEQRKKGDKDMSLEEFGALMEAQQARVKKMSLEEMHEFAEDKMPKGLEDIANRVMSKSNLREFNVFVHMLREERQRRIEGIKFPDGPPKGDPLHDVTKFREIMKTEVVKGEHLDTLRYAAACNLAHTVAFTEKIYGKNVPGEITGEDMDPKKIDGTIISNLTAVTQLMSKAHEMFGHHMFGDDKTKHIYDRTVGRIEMSRAKQRGLKIQDIEFPAFPQPAVAGKK